MSLLSEASGLLNIFKLAAVDAVEQSRPMQIVFGTVTSKSPLKIRLDQKRTLSSTCLILLANSGSVSKGDKVALLQQKGGQEFLVLGKVVK